MKATPDKPIATVMPVVLAVLLIILTIVVFFPTLDNRFLNWDDDRNFLQNPAYRGLGAAQLRWSWQTYHMGVWQPLGWMALGLQYKLGGLEPAVYHAFSLGLHAVNTGVFFMVAALVLRTAGGPSDRPAPRDRGWSAAAAAAALFAVHPLRVEAVSWISAQPYLPAVLFYLLATATYIQGHRHPGPATGRTCVWLCTSLLCFLLAVASKAVAVSLPAVLLILDVYPLRRLGGRAGWRGKNILWVAAEKLPFIAIAVLISIWAAAAKDFNETRMPFDILALDDRLAQSAYGLWFYPLKTIVPTGLIPYCKLPPSEVLSLFRWPYAAAAIGWLVLTITLFLLRRRFPGALAAWAAYVVILAPNLGLVQISRQIVADRYAYLATMPLFILLAGGLLSVSRAGARDRLVRAGMTTLLVMAVAGLTLASRRQVDIWQDSVTLWRANLAIDPECAVAECNLGHALVLAAGTGKNAAEPDDPFRSAAEHLRRATQLRPDFAFAHSNLGVILMDQGHYEEAESSLLAALNSPYPMADADRARTHAALSLTYARLNRPALAWKHIRQAQLLNYPPVKIEAIIDSF